MVLCRPPQACVRFCPKPWGLWGPQAVGKSEVGRTEFLVSFKSPALPGGGALLSSSHCSPVGNRHLGEPELLICT